MNELLKNHFFTSLYKFLELDYKPFKPSEIGGHSVQTYKAMVWDKESRELYQLASGHDIHPKSILCRYFLSGNVEVV